MKVFKHILFILLVTGSYTNFAQAPIPSKHFTVNDGLAQQQITALYQGCHGFIWIGTKGGLSRYNGKSFKNYGSKDGFSDLFVNTIQPYGDSILIIQSKKNIFAFDVV